MVREFRPVPKIKAYPRDLNQVFMTLLMNAFDAIGAKGRINIRTAANDGWVHIEIADNGKGIPQSRLDKIFEIGFGEKDAKVRMRLGLANTHNIIQKHEGEIEVSSEVGRGTEFRIRLPTGLGDGMAAQQPVVS